MKSLWPHYRREDFFWVGWVASGLLLSLDSWWGIFFAVLLVANVAVATGSAKRRRAALQSFLGNYTLDEVIQAGWAELSKERH